VSVPLGRYTYRVLVGKPERKRPLRRLRRRWENNIKMDYQKINLGLGWIHVAQDKVRCRSPVNAAMNLVT
jgi:hypothetical protein